MFTYLLHHLDENIAEKIGSCIEVRQRHIRLQSKQKLNLLALRQRYQLDINWLPPHFDASRIGLFVSDMDNTLISIECIDEMADFAHLKDEITALTKRSLSGQLDFQQSFQQRLRLLKGLPIDVLEKIYQQRLRINAGGELLWHHLGALGIKTALISAGFLYFAEQLQQRLSIDDVFAHQLGVENGRLSGDVVGRVIAPQTKAEILQKLCLKYDVRPEHTVAIGDGANDLMMMRQAGIGIAYRAQQRVKQGADMVIDYGDLATVLDLFDDGQSLLCFQ